MQKVSGQFGVRQAKTGERLALLGDETITLQESDVVITDASDDRSIALAGIKGGEETKVDENTKDVYIEIATFDNVSVRRTMRRTGLTSDAASRFSQGYPPELIDYTTYQVAELFGQYGSITDSFDCRRVSLAQRHKTKVSTDEVNILLGSSYAQKDIASALDRLGLEYKNDNSKKQFTVSVSVERPDIQDTPDLIEEVGRILGYDTVPSVLSESKSFHLLWKRVCNVFVPDNDEMFAKRIAILGTLRSIGFSEVMTSSFRTKDEICVAYPVAKDKGCLRSSLRQGIEEALDQNTYNGELLGLGMVQIAEIGSVFTKGGEKVHLALGVQETLGRKKVDINTVEEMVRRVLIIPGGFESNIWEVSLDEVQVRTHNRVIPSISGVRYVPPSKYPFVLRDIAVFVPNGVSAAKAKTLLRKNGGEHLRQINLFDTFTKNGRQSYAFRLVFQSDTETFNDAAVNKQMNILYKALKKNKYEVR